MKKLIFSGAATALVTPMNPDYSVNYEKVKELVEDQIKNEIDAVVVCGTTGESATLGFSEFEGLISSAVEQAAGRVPIIAGAGSNSTEHAVLLSKTAEKCGADAILSVTPYYNKTSQTGIIRHYNAIADSVSLPVMVYNVPSRTGLNIKPQTYKELSQHPNIVAAKEANGNISALAESIFLCEDSLFFYCGNDDQIVPFLSLGGMGAVSVISNLLPRRIHMLCRNFFDGNTALASQEQLRLIKLTKLLFSDVNPVPVKAAMNILGHGVGPVRLPLCDADADLTELLREELKNF